MRTPFHQRSISWLGAAALAAPAAVLACLLWRYAVNVVFRDSLPYTFLIMEKAFLSHTITFGDFFVPNAEHILALPLVISVGLASVFGWNIRLELFVVLLVAIGNFLLIRDIARTTLKRESALLTFAALMTTSILLFSPNQWEIWTASLTLTYLLATFFFLAAVAIATRFGLTRRSVPALFALCALSSFACTNGMLSWIAILPVVWSLERNAPDREKAFSERHAFTFWWVVFFCVTVFLQRSVFPYVIAIRANYEFPVEHPKAFARHFFTLIGAGVAPYYAQRNLVALLGVCIATTTIVATVRVFLKRNTNALAWVSVLLFFGGSGFLVSAGRSIYGIGGAFVSRYIATTQYVAIATLFLACIAFPKNTRTISAACAAIVAVNLFATPRALATWAHVSMYQRHTLACMQMYDIASDACLDWLYPWDIPMAHLPRNMAPLLQKMGFLDVIDVATFKEWKTDDVEPLGALEYVGGAPKLKETAGTGSVIGGWAILPGCTPVDHIILTTGAKHTVIGHGAAVMDRDDISEKTGCSVRTGWEIFVEKAPKKIDAWVLDEKNVLHKLPSL